MTQAQHSMIGWAARFSSENCVSRSTKGAIAIGGNKSPKLLHDGEPSHSRIRRPYWMAIVTMFDGLPVPLVKFNCSGT